MGARTRSRALDPIAALRRRAARLLWAEAFTRAAGLSLFLLGCYVAAALFGYAAPWAFALTLLLAALALLRGLFKLTPPSRAAIDRRIEAASGLPHRPLAALDDEPEESSPAAAALWAAHRLRLRASLAGARIGPPAPQAAAADPWSLRGLLGLLLITGLIIAGPAAPTRLAGALNLPAWPFPGPVITAWVTPPPYANQPPQLLQPGQPVTALPGAKLTLVIDGPQNAPAVTLAGAALPHTELGHASHRVDAMLTQSGALLVGPWWHRLASWQIKIVPPGAPAITLTGIDITDGNHLKLHFRVDDAYGLTSLAASLRPPEFPRALVQTIPLTPATGDETVSLDLSTSPFHDIPTTLTLTASNQAGVTGHADWPPSLVLPGLPLRDPTAIALDRQRQILALDPRTARLVATAMQRLSQAPPSAITAPADIKLAVLTCAIWLQQTGPQAAVRRLLPLIEEIDAGPDYAPSQALAAANQALTAALQRGLTGQTPDQAALRQMLDALRQALSQHLAALQPNPGAAANAPSMDMSTLEQMAQKIAADEAAGRTEQAAAELRSFKKILASLAGARPMTPAQMASRAAAAAAASDIAQLTQGEASLLDRTHQGQGTAKDQTSLQNQLNQTMQNLAKSGLNLPGLTDAGTAMAAAAAALAQQNGSGAETQENAAIQSLQKAAAALHATQQDSFGMGQNANGTQDNNTGLNGSPDDDPTPYDMNGTSNPARIIEQQIINQDAAPSVPAPTHSYYHRLLQDGVGQ